MVRIESKAPVPASDAMRLERGLEPDPLLGGAGAGEVGVVLVLLHLLQRGAGVVDAVGGDSSRVHRRRARSSRRVAPRAG